MRIRFAAFIIAICLTLTSYANHIVGGEMYYSFIGQSNGNFSYAVTIKLFRDLASGTPLDNPINVAIYEKGTNVLKWSGPVNQSSTNTLNATPSPCIINPPLVSYQVGLYNFSITLPASTNGYTIVWARCCRVANITNLTPPSSGAGATYTAEIPGNSNVANGPENNSARFLGYDTVIICAGYPFTYNFGATDADGDKLTYEFCDGYTNTGGTIPNPPAAPPYTPLSYLAPYTSISPLGSTVTINSQTGIITGTAPGAGIYVITVCVKEWRNGQLIATQRKDLQIKVADCDIATVTLNPNGYINCNDYTVSFSNLTPNPLINSYFWDFGDLTTLGDTSRNNNPSYMYPDTGIYTVKVVANRNQPCSDSTTAKVKVYPGFFPDFSLTSSCLNAPVQFNDLTTTVHGSVNYWHWNFGVIPASNDTSILQNPNYTYTSVGSYTAELVVGSNKGCLDTVYNTVNVIDKPTITMTFRDTLICSVDTVQLGATGSGAIQWTPGYNILNTNSATPYAFPKTTTWYKVEFNENGCRNEDSVRVRVVDFVTLLASNDTTICANDAVQLFASTSGLNYSWSPAATLSNPNILNPVASPAVTTTYQITSTIGGCSATESVIVSIAPRPLINAGSDITICYNETAQLNAVAGGTSFSWSPVNTLNNPAILNPIASPISTTEYILSVIDINSGCAKPITDTVVVTVLPEVVAFAGNDTVIIAGMPLQLKATGGVSYQWSPATNLNNPGIQGPIALLDGNPEYVTYTVTVADQFGCTDTSDITIRVYKTGPEIFVPTGFTPNGDGRNDIFRPIYIGMKKVDFFKVYNRWGELIYSNDKMDGNGWDGTIKGLKQNPGTYIWMVQATDIIDKVHFKKGTVILLR